MSGVGPCFLEMPTQTSASEQLTHFQTLPGDAMESFLAVALCPTSLSSRAISSAVFGALVKSCRFTHRALLKPSPFSVEPVLIDPPTESFVDVADRTDIPPDDPG